MCFGYKKNSKSSNFFHYKMVRAKLLQVKLLQKLTPGFKNQIGITLDKQW